MSFGSSLALSNERYDAKVAESSKKRHQDTQISHNLLLKVSPYDHKKVTAFDMLITKTDYRSSDQNLKGQTQLGSPSLKENELQGQKIADTPDNITSGLLRSSFKCESSDEKGVPQIFPPKNENISSTQTEFIMEARKKKESDYKDSSESSSDSDSSISVHSIKDLRSIINIEENDSSEASTCGRARFWEKPKFVFGSFQNLSENENIMNKMLIEDQLSFKELVSFFTNIQISVQDHTQVFDKISIKKPQTKTSLEQADEHLIIPKMSFRKLTSSSKSHQIISIKDKPEHTAHKIFHSKTLESTSNRLFSTYLNEEISKSASKIFESTEEIKINHAKVQLSIETRKLNLTES